MDTTDEHRRAPDQPLIFTERRRVPRLIDTLLTLMAWVGFLWLIYQGVVLAVLENTTIGPRLFDSTLENITLYLVVAVVYGGILIIWARYNQYRFRRERRSRRPELEDNEVAASFHISIELLGKLKRARVFTVHHNGQGTICAVDIDGFLPG